MSDIQVTSVDGAQISVATGVVVGPLPELQLAAGAGITITNSGGVSTISAKASELSIPANLADLSNVNGTPTTGQVLAWDGSSWAPADGQTGGNIPPGTTVNGLSGDVTLLAGGNINLSTDGQNLTISSDGGGFVSLNPDLLLRQATNLRITRNSLSELSLEWDSPIGYTGVYSVELMEVGVDANVTTSLPPTLNPDGSLSASINAGGVPLGGAVLFAANGSQAVDNQTQFFATIAESISLSGSNATISGAYLPAQFTEPGAVHLLAVGYDQSGYPVGRSDISTLNVTKHGNPVAPEIVSFYGGNGTVEAELYSRQTPHQLGFYDFGQVAYFLEINQDANATTGWTRGDGVAADASGSFGDITLVSVSVSDDADYYARVVAANPLGEGEPRIS